jgi:hypothetical protein
MATEKPPRADAGNNGHRPDVPAGEPPSHHDQRPMFEVDTPLDIPTLTAEAILGLLMAHPHLQRALKRDPDTDAARHGIYDALLAEAAVQEGWDPGAIVALIQEGNTRNSLPVPPLTLCRLIVHEAHLRTKTGDLDFARERVIEMLANAWGLQIVTVIRHGTENALWHLHLLDGREIQLGSSENLMTEGKVRARIFDVTGHVIPRYGTKYAHLWDHHMEQLAMVAQIVDTPEMTREGQARALVLGYLEEQRCRLDREASKEDWGKLALSNKPFVWGGFLYLSLRNFWLTYVRHSAPQLLQTDVLDLLRLLGGRRTKVTINTPSPTSRSVWRLLPARLLEAETPETQETILAEVAQESDTSD